jgi:hypothetical protein
MPNEQGEWHEPFNGIPNMLTYFYFGVLKTLAEVTYADLVAKPSGSL